MLIYILNLYDTVT